MEGQERQKLIDLNLLIKNCTDCKLYKVRNNTVPGSGPVPADIMFIGEGPGYNEDREGEPFSGPSGRFLMRLLSSIGLTRAEVFLANMIKCRAPGDRDPQVDEILECSKYLDRQIELVDPKLIVTLGRYSTSKFLKFSNMTDVRGQVKELNGRYILPIMHPAAALRNIRFEEPIREDFKLIPRIMELPKLKVVQPTKQMELF